ncbi:MAG: hypothetical protein ABW189_05620 [Rickettsiales bacterium]
MQAKEIKPDAQGRITLGAQLTRNVNSFSLNVDDDGTICLTPCVTVPKHELWLYKNKDALNSVRSGVEDVKRGDMSVLDLSEWDD